MTAHKTRPGLAIEAARIDSFNSDKTQKLPKWALDAARHQLADIGTRGDVEFTSPGGKRAIVNDTDWLVQLPNGKVALLEQEVFEQLFEAELPAQVPVDDPANDVPVVESQD